MNWANGLDEKGRPVRVPGKVPTKRGRAHLPGQSGRDQLVFAVVQPAHRPVLHSVLGELLVAVREAGGRVRRRPDVRRRRAARHRSPAVRAGQLINYAKEEEGYGAVRAIDPQTGDMKWEFKMTDFTDAGILTTASNVLFSGGSEGYFFALDARNGRAAVEGARSAAA